MKTLTSEASSIWRVGLSTWSFSASSVGVAEAIGAAAAAGIVGAATAAAGTEIKKSEKNSH